MLRHALYSGMHSTQLTTGRTPGIPRTGISPGLARRGQFLVLYMVTDLDRVLFTTDEEVPNPAAEVKERT